jgi:hypothetical protein
MMAIFSELDVLGPISELQCTNRFSCFHGGKYPHIIMIELSIKLVPSHNLIDPTRTYYSIYP